MDPLRTAIAQGRDVVRMGGVAHLHDVVYADPGGDDAG
jgi:hypothetical protein